MSTRRADRNAAPIQGDGIWLQRPDRIGEQSMQIASVQHQMRRTEALDALMAEVEPVPCFAGAPVTQHPPFRPDLNLGKRRLQSQREKNAAAVGADLDASSYFLQLIGLIVDLDVDATPKQRQRRGQPANTAADDNNIPRRIHGALPAGFSIVLDGRPIIGFSRRTLSPPRPSAEFPQRRSRRNPATNQFWSQSP